MRRLVLRDTQVEVCEEGSVERMEGGRKKEVGWKETMERGAEGLKEKRAEGTANLKGV